MSNMAGSGAAELRTPVFNGENYEFWSIRMKTILKSHGLWDLVEKGLSISDSKKKESENISDEEVTEKSAMAGILMKDARALGLIQSAVSDQLFPRIVNEETSKGAWDILKLEFRGDKQDMFVGGSDTSWTSMLWLMSELLQNPRVMKKVQEEVRRVAGKRGYVDESDIKEMKYLSCVITENLRLHPPAPLLLPRETTADVKLGGYDIPAKTQVFVNAFAIQTDPRVWDKPEEFMPERFEQNSIGFVGQEFELLPFGGGRRVCPGLAFAIASAEYVLANLLFWFDWKLPSGGTKLADTLNMTEVFGLTVHKKAPLYLIPTPYTP